jgi:hypothetical protein
MTHVFMRPIVLALVLSAAACGGSDSPAATTAPTETLAPSVELFEGKLQTRGDSTFFSFTVRTAGNVNVTLASVTTATTPGSSVNLALGVGLGSPLATDCNLTNQTTTGPALTSQLVGNNFSPAIYCVRVFDVGNLTVPINFAVRISHP